MRKLTQPASYTHSFDDVAADEQLWTQRRREALKQAVDAPRVGLALSGGGIRSATFNAGLLNSLDRHGLLCRVDYLSTVSGGGYIGACVSRLLNHRQSPQSNTAPLFDTPVGSEQTPLLNWLRAHGKYLISETGFSGWTLAASILASTLLNLLVFLPVMLLLMGIMSRDVLSISWPLERYASLPAGAATHDGYSLFLLSSLLCFASYAIMVLVYAAVSGVRRWRTAGRVLRLRRWMGRALKFGVVVGAVGLIPILTLVDEWLLARLASGTHLQSIQHATWLAPLSGGLIAAWRAMRGKHRPAARRRLAGVALVLVLAGSALFSYHLVAHTGLLSSPLYWAALAVGVVVGLFCDTNWVSMHSYYRARIARAFLPSCQSRSGQLKDTGLEDALQSMTPYSGAPLHLINCTLNTRTSKDAKRRNREGGSFVLSSLYCGGHATGFKRTSDYLGGRLSLSAAATVSGAAVDPNNCLVRSRSLSVLMSLLNCRLGYWADNPARGALPFVGADWFTLVGREILSAGLDESCRKVHLSDGGQFDNLGIYELVRRRCEFIIASDAGADPQCTLSDLGKVIDRVRADFGAEISMDVSTLVEQCQVQRGYSPCAIGTVRYADGSTGQILYIKASHCDDPPVNVYAYASEHAAFPHESTANQFFDEAQFDAYETLGRCIVDRLVGESSSIEQLFASIAARSVGDKTATSPIERRALNSPMRQVMADTEQNAPRSIGTA
ncbi:MAG: patatin-like phospholipase family protein [Pseudomonadota bacterium]